MKKYFYFIVAVLGLTLAACDESTTEPEPVTTGSVYITSTPAGAAIWMGATNQGKVTPDSLTALEAGNYQVTLKLTGYKDTTFTVTITAGQKTTKSVTLTESLVTQTFGPIRLWETTGTTSEQKSGLDLSTGLAQSTSLASEKGNVDLYYSSDGFLVRSADYTGLTRVTYFKVGSAGLLTDGVDSPTKDNTWIKNMGDRETNYVFLLDNDGNYSKLKITSYGGGTPGNPAYVEVQWIYNKTVGDKRF